MKESPRRVGRIVRLCWGLMVLPLPLVGCVPLDGAGPGQDQDQGTHAPQDCGDSVATAGKPRPEGWQMITAMELDTTSGGSRTTVFLDSGFGPALFGDEDSPANLVPLLPSIGADTGYDITGTASGFEAVSRHLSGIPGPGKTLGYKAMEILSVPITLVCGTQRTNLTLRTSNQSETGLIDCSLPWNDVQGSASAMARTQYCPRDWPATD
ncbi:MAG: hypothetical protein Q4P23_07045 [Micrococcaceae bacterium]|nr:hypothetical protein [Micrococcaceae bacterium]